MMIGGMSTLNAGALLGFGCFFIFGSLSHRIATLTWIRQAAIRGIHRTFRCLMSCQTHLKERIASLFMPSRDRRILVKGKSCMAKNDR